MSAIRLFLSQLAFVLGILGLTMCVGWGILRPKMGWFAVAPGSWFLHVVVFYGYIILFNPVVSEFNAIWSLALRYHALFLVMGTVLVFMIDRENDFDAT